MEDDLNRPMDREEAEAFFRILEDFKRITAKEELSIGIKEFARRYVLHGGR